MKTIPPLVQLHHDIDARVQSIRQDQPEWLCGKGCDGCCRSLADVPQLTAEEWALLREGLSTLSPDRLADIHRAIASLLNGNQPPTRSVVCPLLDQATGACPVYVHRPVACRTYGFYVQRDKGLYCRDIESLVAEGALSSTVWGSHDVIDRQLAGLGESRPLTEWFEREQAGSTPLLSGD